MKIKLSAKLNAESLKKKIILTIFCVKRFSITDIKLLTMLHLENFKAKVKCF